MHSSLLLRGGAPNLEPEVSIVKPLPGHVEALDSGILHAVANALAEVRDVAAEGALVDDASGNSLGDLDLDGVVSPDVAFLGALAHGFDGSHAAVALEADSVLEEVLPGGYRGG